MDEQSEGFTGYDSADYLTGIEDVAAYLEAAIEEVSELARRVGMSREGLYKALSAEGNPSFATILRVAHALGLRIHFESVA